MTIVPKAIYRFNAIPIQLPMAIFIDLEQNILQFFTETPKTLNSQSNLEKEWQLEKLVSLTSDYTPWKQYVQKDRNTDQWDRTERSEINPCTYGHLIYDKGGKNI